METTPERGNFFEKFDEPNFEELTSGIVELASPPIVKVCLNPPKLNPFMPRTSTDVAFRYVMTNQESRKADG